MKIVTNKYSKQTPKSKKVLLNPAEKGHLYAESLKQDRRAYIDPETEGVRFGEKKLSDGAKAYRRGYLQARKDNAKAWKSKKQLAR